MPSSRMGNNRSKQSIGKQVIRTLLATGLVANALVSSTFGAEPTAASKMFPNTTQALLSLPNTPTFIERLEQIQLGKLVQNDKLVPFWETQRQELESRLSESGWQINLRADDLEQLSAGQTSIGWIARETANKPYSIALVIDIQDRKTEAERFLQRVDTQLKGRNAKIKQWDVGDAKITSYSVPALANESHIIETSYATHGEQLIVTDDEATMRELLAAQAGDKADSLANSDLYKEVLAKIEADGPAEAEYFVRPLGIAKLIRSIGAKAPKNQQDLLKLIDDQGFGAIECAMGHIHFAMEDFDVFHHGFIKLKKPVKTAVEILDFPNVESLQAPVWLSKNTATVVGFSWNLKDAFMKFEPLVDNYLDPERPGTFSEIMEGIRDDIQGPQIDVAKEVLPYLTSEFFISTEVVMPITTESKRSLVLLKLNDPEKKLHRVMDRYGKNEANGTPLDYNGYRIWSFKNEEEVEIELDFGSSKSSSMDEEDEETEAPLLDHWAISIIDGYFVFGSDAELIKELADRVKEAPQESELMKEPDVTRVAQMLDAVAASNSLSARQFNRTALAFELQYELFREGNLNSSRSILAAILDRLIDPKNKKRDQEQKLNGADLPPFDTIRSYFMPTGSVVRTEEDGWSIQSFVLKKEE